MFEIIKSIKKMTGMGKKDEKSTATSPQDERKNIISDKIEKLSGFFNYAVDQAVSEYNAVKERSKDLSTTNLNLGLKYLKEGNLSEAIFRFKITKKFWPNNYEAYYQLIICLILNEEFDEAEKVMKELSEKSPEYKAKIEQTFGDHVTPAPQENTTLNQNA